MKRNVVNIGEHRFLIEHYDADTDLGNIQYYAEFVMLRNFSIINNIANDTDIYIIEKSFFNEYIKELKENNDHYGESIVFPNTLSDIISYSNSYIKFNSNFNLNDNLSIYNGDEYGDSVYEIYEKKNNRLVSKKIKCDKIRIYHPISKKKLNAIIDVTNYINNIHFHYLCKQINDYESKTETEIKLNNEAYSEFIEIYYPNLNDLFKINDAGEYMTFYKEDMDIVASTKNEKFINSIMSNSSDLIQSEDYNGAQIIPMNLLIQPYRIVEEYAAENALNYDEDLSNDDKIFVKMYLKNKLSIENNYLTYPINVIIYPFSGIDNELQLYRIDDSLNSVTASFTNNIKFELNSRLGFDSGIISIVTFFKYPNESYFYNLYKNDSTTTPIKEAYIYYNSINKDIYNMFINEDIQKQLETVDNVKSINDQIKKQVIEITNTAYEDDDAILDKWKSLMKESIIKEYEDEMGTPTNFLGFKVQVSSSILFNNIIYDKNVRINLDDLDDFSFALNGIFKQYKQFPEQLAARILFYDRILGIEIVSNPIIISNEWRKYLINDNDIYRLHNLSQINYSLGNSDDMKEIRLQEDNINFINNIKCRINKNDSINAIKPSESNMQKIIFKPIFYKVKELQNIKLVRGIAQNIGINLSEYMTKVETFKINIDGTQYVETGRNDIYVIFNINTAIIAKTSGYYNIVNQDDEYISSGNWEIK